MLLAFMYVLLCTGSSVTKSPAIGWLGPLDPLMKSFILEGHTGPERGFDLHERFWIGFNAIGMNGYGAGLPEFDSMSSIDQGKRNEYLVRAHTPYSYPYVGWKPVVVRLWRDDNDLMVFAKPFAEKRSSGMSGHASAENNNSCHDV